MASLNTLRTKFGMVLSIVIALALLAFILSLKTEMGFSGNDPKVGEIAGRNIRYSEYYNEYEQIKSQNNIQESDEQQSQMLANAVWQTLFSKHVLMPGFSQLGLRVGDAERLAMISGQIPTQTLFNLFMDPATGEYNVAAVTEFLSQAERDPQVQQLWAGIKEQLQTEREAQKYYGLVRGGAYVNSLEVATGVDAANKSYAGQWAGMRYASVPDSLFTVTNTELKNYYNDHKQNYKQLPNRTISYVLFEVAPTDADLEALERKAMTTGEEFAAAEDLRAFVRADAHGSVDDRYLSAAQLQSDEAEALLAGNMYGPVLKNNAWIMARVLDTKMAPDSVGVRHIVLSYTDRALADSLKAVARSGADFAGLARQYSLYEATAVNGGDIGVMPFSAFNGEFAEQLAGAKTGDVVEIASGDVIQLMQVYKAGKPQKQVMVASISYPLEASDATRGTAHNQAGTFTVKAKGSLDAFNTAASEAAVTPRIATLSEGDRLLNGMEDSRELVRWAFGAKKGELSEIFTIGKDYVVATVTEIDDSEYTPLNRVAPQVRAQVLRDKKYDYIVKQLSGATLEEQAKSLDSEVADFADVTLGSYFVDGIGFEPRVLGVIATTGEGTVSAPVKGMSGVFVVRVDNVQNEEKQTTEGEQVRAQATLEAMLQQLTLPAIQQMAEMRDLRGKYF